MKKVSRNVKSGFLHGASIVAVIVAITPYLFYSYEIFPVTGVWKNFLFTYESGFYESVNTAFWVILGKAIPFLLMLLWFISCKHWWYRVILVPMSMYGFQLYSVLKDEHEYIDKYEMYFIVPVVIATLSLSYLTRMRLQNSIQDLEELENDVEKPSDYFFNE